MLTASASLNKIFIERHPKDVARFLEDQGSSIAIPLLNNMSFAALKTLWHCLTPGKRQYYFLKLPEATEVELLQSLDVAPCAAFLNHLSVERQKYFLDKLPADYAGYVKEYLAYPEDVAGSMMSKAANAYAEHMTVGQVLTQIKQHKLNRSVYVYVVDDQLKLTGRVNLQRLLIAEDEELVSAIATPNPLALNCLAPRDEIIATFEKSKLDSMPVVDASGLLVGIIYASRLIESIKEDATLDIQTMVGASADEQALSPAGFVIRKRLPWLLINLLTAFTAASVVGAFEGLIAKFTALAVLMPVVAGQSGNAGAQALAVTMRGLALREVSVAQWLKVVSKELIVGCCSGVVVALVCAVAVYFWSGSLGLAFVLALSMTVSVIIACISGSLVPIILKKIGQDPAQSSSIILTTITDVIGFFSFLGTALLLAAYL